MNDKKLTDKELEVTPDDKIVAKMKKMVFVDDEDVVRTAIKLARQDERRRVIRIIEKEKREIEGWIKVCTFEELEKTGDIFSVLEMILKKIKSGENSTGTAPAKSRKERDWNE